MQSELIKLANDRLIGEWHHIKSRKQLIIVCHGFRSSSENPTITAVTKGLNKRGHDTFTFNFSGNTGGFDIEHQVKDIMQIVGHFKDYKEFVLLASSFAALSAAIAAIKHLKISRLITLNGFFGERDLGHEHRRSYMKFRAAALVIPKYRKILRYYKRELQPDHINVPVLVIHSKADKYVYIKQSRHFYDQLETPKQFVKLDTANHGITSSSDRQVVVLEVDKWLKQSRFESK